jgi:hypothetical protein
MYVFEWMKEKTNDNSQLWLSLQAYPLSMYYQINQFKSVILI